MPFLFRFLVKNELKYRYNSRYNRGDNKVNKTPNSSARSHPFESRAPVVKRFLPRPEVNKMLTMAKMIRDFLPDNARYGTSKQTHDEHGFLSLGRVKRVVDRGFSEIIPLCAFSFQYIHSVSGKVAFFLGGEAVASGLWSVASKGSGEWGTTIVIPYRSA